MPHHRLVPPGGVRIAQSAFTVTHDQQNSHTQIVRAFLEIGEVTPIAGFVLEELIHQFDGVDSVVVLGCSREINMIDLSIKESPMKRPLGD